MAAKLDSLGEPFYSGLPKTTKLWSVSAAKLNSNSELDVTIGQAGIVAGSGAPPSAVALSEALGLHAGDEVGRYLLLSTLGAGAMGVVFSAYDPDLNRKVALKFIQPDPTDLGSASHANVTARSRLLQEAQAMARVRHPNVVTVYDAGTVGSHVYLAMELIEGQTMKDWIRQGGYSQSKMLGNMSAAGRGLASAHDAGLVHRDFKPDNVLLGNDGRLCVADFGLVRQVQGGMVSQTGLIDIEATIPGTRTVATVIGTPSYMSPEQLRGEIATAFSDQFSFCVSLFEAAYGVRPFFGRNPREIATAIERGCMTIPPDERKVPRWLQRIILRGLSLDPKDRYPTMHDLLVDLTMDRGVLLRKWVAGGLAVASLTVGIIYHELNAMDAGPRCRLEESQIEELWSEKHQLEVQRVFFASGLSYAHRAWMAVNEAMQRQVREWSETAESVCEQYSPEKSYVPEDIDLQIGCLENQLEQIQTFSDILRQADTSTIDKSGDVARALLSSTDCQDPDQLRVRNSTPVSPKYRVAAQGLRKQLAKSTMLLKMGQHASSCYMGRDILERAKVIDHAPLLAQVYNHLAVQRCGQDWYSRSSSYNLSALSYAESGQDDRLIAQILSSGVFIHGCILGERSSLDTWIPHAQAHLRRAGDPPLLRASFLSDIGAAYGTHELFEESEAALREAVEVLEQEVGNSHPELLRIRSNLATSLHRQHRAEQSVMQNRKAIEHGEANLGPDHPLLVLPIRNLAAGLMDMGLFSEALVSAERSLNITETASGVDAPQALQDYRSRGDLLERAGKYQRSLEDRRRTVHLIEAMRQSETLRDSDYSRLASTLSRLGKWEEANEAIKKVKLERRFSGDVLGWQYPYTTAMEVALGGKDIALAERIYRELMGLGIDFFGFGSGTDSGVGFGRYAKIGLVVGNLKLALNQPEEAIRYHQFAYSRARERHPGEENVNLVPYERALARSNAALGDWSEAIVWMDWAIEKLQASLSDSPHMLASAYLQLAKLYGQSKQWDQARRFVRRAAEHQYPSEMDPREMAEITQFKAELDSTK